MLFSFCLKIYQFEMINSKLNLKIALRAFLTTDLSISLKSKDFLFLHVLTISKTTLNNDFCLSRYPVFPLLSQVQWWCRPTLYNAVQYFSYSFNIIFIYSCFLLYCIIGQFVLYSNVNNLRNSSYLLGILFLIYFTCFCFMKWFLKAFIDSSVLNRVYFFSVHIFNLVIPITDCKNRKMVTDVINQKCAYCLIFSVICKNVVYESGSMWCDSSRSGYFRDQVHAVHCVNKVYTWIHNPSVQSPFLYPC